MDDDFFSELARQTADFDRAIEVDPLARRKHASLAELGILDLMFHCLPTDEQIFVDENGNIIKRVELSDTLHLAEGGVTLDRVQTPDGQRRTVIDMSGKGWGVYAIDGATGRHTYFKNGVEKRAGHRRRNKLARKLARLDFKYDESTYGKGHNQTQI